MTTIEEYRSGAYCKALRDFLECPAGQALVQLLEQRARPDINAKKQLGNAEDVKLQMSLNYAKMMETFEVLDFIRSLSSPKAATAHPPVPDLIPENATPDQLKMWGIQIPSKKESQSTQPVTV